jgi:hypothetical protein
MTSRFALLLLVSSARAFSQTPAFLRLSSTSSRTTSTSSHQQPRDSSALFASSLKDDELEYESFYLENEAYMIGNNSKPASGFILGGKNFMREGSSIIEQVLADYFGITSKSYIPRSERPPDCLGFTLDDVKVKEAELRREARPGGEVETNPVARALYDVGCFALDELFVGRPIARFWFLETIARIPYFSYVSMLHLYESFGWWRGIELRRVHNAEGAYSIRCDLLCRSSRSPSTLHVVD